MILKLLVVLALFSSFVLCEVDRNIQQPHYKDGEHNFKSHSSDPNLRNDHQLSPLEQILELSEQSWEGIEKKEIGRAWKTAFPLVEFPEYNLAFCFNFANVVIVQLPTGLVMIDSGSLLSSEGIFNEIQTWKPELPLLYAIWTHGHYDHVFGIQHYEALATEKDWPKPQVIAHKGVPERFDRYRYTNGYNSLINAVQFQGKPKAQFLLPTDFRMPDIVYDQEYNLTVDGEVFEIYHAKGETDDAR